MKRVVSILIALLIFACAAVVPASAATPAQTKVSAKKGEEVIYSLNLTVPSDKVVGCDLSIYYDSAQLKPIASADFTGDFDADNQQAFLNHNLNGEAKCVFSILNGVDFKKEKSIFSVKFQAKKDIKDAHIKYYVRYLYPSDMVQFTDYKFTCDVTVNGKKVTDSKAPELNTKDKQEQGLFVNSVTGNGDDADVNMADTQENKPNNNNNNNNNNGKDNTDNNTPEKSTSDKNTPEKETEEKSTEKETSSGDKKESGSKSDKELEKATESGTTAKTDAKNEKSENKKESSNDNQSKSIFTSPWFWIGVAIVVLAAGVVMFVIVMKKNKK